LLVPFLLCLDRKSAKYATPEHFPNLPKQLSGLQAATYVQSGTIHPFMEHRHLWYVNSAIQGPIHQLSVREPAHFVEQECFKQEKE
jgi:hypothetical protein